MEDKTDIDILPSADESTTTCDCLNNSKTNPLNDNGGEENDNNGMRACSNPNCPFGYLKRDAFTSEAFKIQVKNILRHAGFAQMKKLLQSLNVNFRKLKLIRGSLAFLSFESAADRDSAISVLDGYNWKGSKLIVKIARPHADPLLKRRAENELNFESDLKRRHVDSLTEPVDLEKAREDLRDSIVPLWRLNYDPDQLVEKRNGVLKCLAETRRQLLITNREILDMESVKYSEELDSEGRPTICKLAPIIPSPVQTQYRNKSELTIGYDVDGSGPIIGFRYSKYKGGSVAVGSYKSWNFLPKKSSKIIDTLQEFINTCSRGELKNLSKLIAFDPITQKGHWRQVLIRESRSGDTLLVVYINGDGLTGDDIDCLSIELQKWFQAGPGLNSGLTSLHLSIRTQSDDKSYSENLKEIFGETYIVEQCCGLNFRVSMSAFFQVNTLTAELLFERISCLCLSPFKNEDTSNQAPAVKQELDNQRPTPDIPQKRERILIDVCCGTGTIALCLAKHFDRVIGIEAYSSAVDDAKLNAESNGIRNAEFFAGKAEDVLQLTLDKLPTNCDLSVVVDPPRVGLHHSVIQTLRRCQRIERIIYVSCNIECAIANFISFARPCSKRFQGIPFIPIMAEAVDLFPQTRHVEVILLLERVQFKS
ncbi:unnamed protein product [Heterobilharzia americana]|nr:unnamed protein product [Heterobilharzia americana]